MRRTRSSVVAVKPLAQPGSNPVQADRAGDARGMPETQSCRRSRVNGTFGICAGGGTRTLIGLAPRLILSQLRKPISPLRHAVRIRKGQRSSEVAHLLSRIGGPLLGLLALPLPALVLRVQLRAAAGHPVAHALPRRAVRRKREGKPMAIRALHGHAVAAHGDRGHRQAAPLAVPRRVRQQFAQALADLPSTDAWPIPYTIRDRRGFWLRRLFAPDHWPAASPGKGRMLN